LHFCEKRVLYFKGAVISNVVKVAMSLPRDDPDNTCTNCDCRAFGLF